MSLPTHRINIDRYECLERESNLRTLIVLTGEHVLCLRSHGHSDRLRHICLAETNSEIFVRQNSRPTEGVSSGLLPEGPSRSQT
jgi:hypothetical protein